MRSQACFNIRLFPSLLRGLDVFSIEEKIVWLVTISHQLNQLNQGFRCFGSNTSHRFSIPSNLIIYSQRVSCKQRQTLRIFQALLPFVLSRQISKGYLKRILITRDVSLIKLVNNDHFKLKIGVFCNHEIFPLTMIIHTVITSLISEFQKEINTFGQYITESLL